MPLLWIRYCFISFSFASFFVCEYLFVMDFVDSVVQCMHACVCVSVLFFHLLFCIHINIAVDFVLWLIFVFPRDVDSYVSVYYYFMCL